MAAPARAESRAAREIFSGEDPIGRFIENFGPDDETMQIVDVIGNIRHLALETAPRPELYQPLGQGKWPRMFFAVRDSVRAKRDPQC